MDLSLNYWLFGLSGSGKTTIGDALSRELKSMNHAYCRIDGDVLRKTVSGDLGFSAEDRAENINRAITIAGWENACNRIVIATFITPFIELRALVRKRVPNVKLIWVDAPLHVCEDRDPKGLYKKARAGEIPDFTGISSPFDWPTNFDMRVKTEWNSVEECVDLILKRWQ